MLLPHPSSRSTPTTFVRSVLVRTPGRRWWPCDLPGLTLPGVLLVLAIAGGADAQGVGRRDVSGVVIDPAGAVVADAGVTLVPLATNSGERRTTSGSDGTFRFAGVVDGRYLLTAEAPGFDGAADELVVDPSLGPTTATLRVAAFTQSVTVQADLRASVARTTSPLTDLPVTVTVISASTLQRFAVNDLVAALQTVPNVNAYNQYGVYEYYSFRGFTDSVQTVDGVRTEGNRVRTQLANVERVEVLKGPASVLYGTDAIGATVNIVLRKPAPMPAYDASVSLGSWNTTRTTFGAGGRLAGPRLLYRLDAGLDHSAGFRHDRSDRFNVTPTVTWRISDRDQLEVRYGANRTDLSGDSGIPLQTRPDGTQVIPDIPRDRRFNTPADFALSVDHNVRAAYTRLLTDQLTLRGTFSARRYDDEYWVAETLRANGAGEVTREFLYFKHARRPYFGQAELAGQVRAGVDHNILAGWERQNYRTRTTRSVEASGLTTPIDLFTPVDTHTTWTDFPASRYDYTRLRTNAFYAQDTLTLGLSLKAVAGFRVDHLRRRTHNNPVAGGVETPVEPVIRQSRALTYRVGLVYQPHPNVDLFAQHTTGFRPNYNLQPDGSPIDPETGRQFEVGQRLRLLRSRVDVTMSVFQVEKDNIALSRPGGSFDLAGSIRSRGLEQEVEWRPSGTARLNVGYGFTDARYVDYVTTAAAFSGNQRPRTPRHSLTASATFAFSSGIAVAVSSQSRGRQFLDDANTVGLGAYGLLNLSASYTRGRLQYGLALSNLTGTDYWASALGNSQLYPGEPLRVVATLRLLAR